MKIRKNSKKKLNFCQFLVYKHLELCYNIIINIKNNLLGVFMLTIQHKMYGEGRVINKEIKENDIIITAQFEDGKECRFSAAKRHSFPSSN